MKLVPHNDYVACEKIEVKDNINELLFSYNKEEFPIYKIINIGSNLKDFRYSVDDKIICNSIGTRVNVDNSLIYLFKSENIMGKIN